MGEAGQLEPEALRPEILAVDEGISLIKPLSRRGYGPGLVLISYANEDPKSSNGYETEHSVPSPPIKWAEEGYTVVELQESAFTGRDNPITRAITCLFKCDACQPREKVGLICYNPTLWKRHSTDIISIPDIAGSIIYGDVNDAGNLAEASCPCLYHLAGKSPSKLRRSENLKLYDYPNALSFAFATPFQKDFHYASEAISHTRNLSFLKPLMNGPYFDLEAIWDEHTYYEFEKRSVPDTMATMVEEPYVNHVPTLTGGIGRVHLTDFYQNHFVFNNPTDTELELISRTVGVDRVVDEFIYKFTHTLTIDWLLPGIPPTGQRAEIPFTAIVNIRGDRLYHEHISWDQGTLLAQLGLLPDYLPYPYPLPNLKMGEVDKRYEYCLPVAGIETANKMRDRESVESNQMFSFAIREAPEGI